MDKYFIDNGKLYISKKIKQGYKLTFVKPRYNNDMAVTWAHSYLNHVDTSGIEYYNLRHGTTVAFKINNRGHITSATAKCKKDDNFSMVVGHAIATARLLGDKVPSFI